MSVPQCGRILIETVAFRTATLNLQSYSPKPSRQQNRICRINIVWRPQPKTSDISPCSAALVEARCALSGFREGCSGQEDLGSELVELIVQAFGDLGLYPALHLLLLLCIMVGYLRGMLLGGGTGSPLKLHRHEASNFLFLGASKG